MFSDTSLVPLWEACPHFSAGNLMKLKYTPQKMFLLAFSFANFETTRGSREKAKISTTLPKKSYSSIFKIRK